MQIERSTVQSRLVAFLLVYYVFETNLLYPFFGPEEYILSASRHPLFWKTLDAKWYFCFIPLIVDSSIVDNIISQISNSENAHENCDEPKTTVLSTSSVNSKTYNDKINIGQVDSLSKPTVSQEKVNEVEEPNQVVESIDWNVLKQSGMSELKSVGPSTKKTIPRSDLLSHVPSETTVVKYGYIEYRVLDILVNIIETSGVLSRKTLDSISIEDMNLTEDGRDINVRFRINSASKRYTKQNSSYGRAKSPSFDDSDAFFDDLCTHIGMYFDIDIRNDRYIEKRENKKRERSEKELIVCL